MKVNQVIAAAAFVTLLLRPDQVRADPVLAGVTVGTQAPASIAPGESAKFPMMLSKSGIGSLDAYLSISGLPAGAAAAFSPEKVSFTAYSRPSLPATLTISTEASTQPGAYPFVVTARHGSSKKFEIANGTLV